LLTPASGGFFFARVFAGIFAFALFPIRFASGEANLKSAAAMSLHQ
jgi:hypothetical protein